VLIAMLLVDTVGRRPLLLFGSSITAVAMLVVAAVSV
jgi:Sugar (and other) transporter